MIDCVLGGIGTQAFSFARPIRLGLISPEITAFRGELDFRSGVSLTTAGAQVR
jgi:hypothetical protein